VGNGTQVFWPEIGGGRLTQACKFG
jgi:hypothetical protein